MKNFFKCQFFKEVKFLKNNYKFKRLVGFTLVELLVVISIIGLLSMIVFDSLSESKLKARNSTIKSNLITLRNVGALFFENNNKFTDVVVSGNCTDSGGVNPVYPQTVAQAKRVFFADNPGWNALHQSIDLSSDITDSYCLVTSSKYAIVVRLATGGEFGDLEADTVCVDNNGSMTLKALAVGETAKDSIDFMQLRCAN